MTPRDERAEQLRKHLVQHLLVPVRLTVTSNRRSMVSFKWSCSGLAVRVHRMFLADQEMWRPLAAFCRRPFGENRRAIDDYIRRRQGTIDATAALQTRVVQLETAGEHHDLAALFERLNAKHFKRRCDARVTWGRAANGRNRRGIQLGSYDPATNIIRIHRALDRAWTPRYVVEHLLYHEMLHWLFRPRKAGSRRVVHGQAFRDAERAHPNYERTQQWVRDNLDRLLKG